LTTCTEDDLAALDHLLDLVGAHAPARPLRHFLHGVFGADLLDVSRVDGLGSLRRFNRNLFHVAGSGLRLAVAARLKARLARLRGRRQQARDLRRHAVDAPHRQGRRERVQRAPRRRRLPVRAPALGTARRIGGRFGAGIGLGLGLRFGLGFFLQKRLPIGYRDLIVVGMDFTEGQEAVAIAAVVDEGGLQRRLDARDLCQIDVAAERFACGRLVVELLYPAVAKHHDPGLFRVRGVNEHLVLIVHVMGSLARRWTARGRP
jgi:hypothetical protein